MNSVQKDIHTLIAFAEQAVEKELHTVRDAAQAEMEMTLRAELDRLLALKAVNPNIRDDEVELLENQINELTGYIAKAQVQLDSLRLIVVSHG
ncbi:RNA polymerase associated protein RapA [Photobacterium aphoticum]|uniref:RNA polymerase associated protein RapA n=1 Tax=Photobacterium aphoticum TaxID=754436 RepID=A0A090QYQ7_9GAMM|nr:RNA polymerase associated protein RapA [Photobacterium aphoticum]